MSEEVKRGRGRPKGSKNKVKKDVEAVTNEDTVDKVEEVTEDTEVTDKEEGEEDKE